MEDMVDVQCGDYAVLSGFLVETTDLNVAPCRLSRS